LVDKELLFNQLFVFCKFQIWNFCPLAKHSARKETEAQMNSRINSELASGFMPGEHLNEGASD